MRYEFGIRCSDTLWCYNDIGNWWMYSDIGSLWLTTWGASIRLHVAWFCIATLVMRNWLNTLVIGNYIRYQLPVLYSDMWFQWFDNFARFSFTTLRPLILAVGASSSAVVGSCAWIPGREGVGAFAGVRAQAFAHETPALPRCEHGAWCIVASIAYFWDIYYYFLCIALLDVCL